MPNPETMLADLFAALPAMPEHHRPGTPLYAFLKAAARSAVETLFSSEEDTPKAFGPFGDLRFPYHGMGACSSLNLFDLDELILFAFYWANRARYRKVVDAGANLGLHSIILSRCGCDVTSFEPDPVHYQLLTRNLGLNGCPGVRPVNAALAVEAGSLEFVRVLGNTTSSHLAGAKPHPYGELERFQVEVQAFNAQLAGVDLVKLDVEGLEREILLATSRDHWAHTDALIEVESARNAEAVFGHMQQQGLSLFSQKTGWHRVNTIDDMPTSYREGMLFLTSGTTMPWGEAS